MCRNKGDEDTDSINSSRSSSIDSTDGHGPCVDQVIPLRSVESNKRRTSQWSSPPRASRGTAVGVALICAITVAISASLCSGCFGWLYRADSDACGGSRRDEAKVKMDDGAAAKKDNHRPWRRPIRGIVRMFREGQDDRRKRRKLKLEVERDNRGASEGGLGSKKNDSKTHRGGRKASSSSSSGSSSGESRIFQTLPGVLVPQSGAIRGGAKKEDSGEQTGEEISQKKRKKKKRRHKDASPGGKAGEEDTTTKRKRRALQALWGGVIGKLGGGGGNNGGSWGSRRGARGGKGEETMRKIGMMKELRKGVEERHGREFWERAKTANHELDDDLLMRYLEMAYWTMETMGQTLPDAVASTVRWREAAGPHLLTDQQVAEEAMYGKMYVRGFDREGRPIIHYRPGLERSFDVEKGLNLLFYTLERAENMLPKGQTQFAVVADCSGFGPSKTPPLPMLKTAFVTMQRHYPMRLGYVVIVNAGGPIVFLWKVISAVLEDRTKDKIAFLSNKDAASRLAGLIDPTALPAALPGGLDDFTYTNEVYLSSP
ncbi:unnamed protein product [Pylaiella littoralis]